MSTQEGLQLARRLGACYFDELSAMEDGAVACMEVMDECIRHALSARHAARHRYKPSTKLARAITRKHEELMRSITAVPADYWVGWKPRTFLMAEVCFRSQPKCPK